MEIVPKDAFNLLNITDKKQLKKFYSKWSVAASKEILKYVKENSLSWFNQTIKNKSKEIPFFIRTKAPKTFIGNVWFVSRPANYVYAKGVDKFKVKYLPIPKDGRKLKAIFAYERWFKPNQYKPDITNINRSMINDIEGDVRFFVSKTSHDVTHTYKRPMLWYQNKATKKVGPVTLKTQAADELYNDPELRLIIYEAFTSTVESFNL